ncbi:bifunctional DNA primase/polymerase [Parasporobacterium paucivorans]|uniref:Uncharacterized protein n=1 Tax=Parasporobacterium paucivorans DSM 15970 TaxID=1122934 RepID=A0A1M6AY38_9FIRM|nr:hypothetical protein [Parasporobacterium paucivorans]SHI41382.1 hypothetical protein SAMN02745691_00211 [Parasporobacterium paucivorans DSM 15970]
MRTYYDETKKVLKKIKMLKGKESVTEIRILKTPKGTLSGFFNDDEILAKCIDTYIGKYNIYFTINPVKTVLLSHSENQLTEYARSTTSDADIEKLNVLMIDLDPKRPSNISATEAEHNKAIKKTQEIKDFLISQGWPTPIVADSGNGGHLLFKIDLLNNQEGTNLLKNVLKALDSLFSDSEVEVDKTTYNASRICKLYGTIACKGKDTEERPHRMARILDCPEAIETIMKDQLQAIASLYPVEEKSVGTCAPTKIDIERWLTDKNLKVTKVKSVGNGTIYVLENCPWRPEHTDGSAFIIQFDNGAVAAGCHHNSCSQENWQSLRDRLEPEWRKARLSSKKDDGESKESQSDILIESGSKAQFFQDNMEENYAAVEMDGHKEVYKINSKKLRLWLTKAFYSKTWVFRLNSARFSLFRCTCFR